MADAPFDVRIVQQLFFLILCQSQILRQSLSFIKKILPCALIFIGCRHGAYKFRSQRQRPFFNGEVKVVFAVFPIQIALIAFCGFFLCKLTLFTPFLNAAALQFVFQIVMKLPLGIH